MTTVPIPIGRLMPPEPPEKWRTIRAALDSDAKTRRLCRILLFSAIPVVLIAVLIVLAAIYLRLQRTGAPQRDHATRHLGDAWTVPTLP